MSQLDIPQTGGLVPMGQYEAVLRAWQQLPNQYYEPDAEDPRDRGHPTSIILHWQLLSGGNMVGRQFSERVTPVLSPRSNLGKRVKGLLGELPPAWGLKEHEGGLWLVSPEVDDVGTAEDGQAVKLTGRIATLHIVEYETTAGNERNKIELLKPGKDRPLPPDLPDVRLWEDRSGDGEAATDLPW